MQSIIEILLGLAQCLEDKFIPVQRLHSHRDPGLWRREAPPEFCLIIRANHDGCDAVKPDSGVAGFLQARRRTSCTAETLRWAAFPSWWAPSQRTP